MSFVLCIPTLSQAGALRTVDLIVEARRGASRSPDIFFVVDNGGHFNAHHRARARALAFDDDLPLVVYTPGSNIGVGPAWNEALRRYSLSFGEVVFANDDITLSRKSIEHLLAPDAPMTNTQGHGFSFFKIRRDLFLKIGFFDEGFAPAYYEDTDYLRRMQLAGIERAIVDTGIGHREQSTSKDMGWDAQALIDRSGVRYTSKWGGFPPSAQHPKEKEAFQHPWGIDMEVCIPSCHTHNLQRLITSLAWQTVRPSRVTIASNADIRIDTHGLSVRQVKFRSDRYAVGEGDTSLRRNVATWAATSPYIVYSDDDQVWPQTAMEWFARRFSTGEHFVVGHHRFVKGLNDCWPSLRTAKPAVGAARENILNASHWWPSCWGGCVGASAMLLKYGVGGWDQGYPQCEDQQLARRICGEGDDSQFRVYEPPWAWHEQDAIHQPPWIEPHSNVCARGTHEMVDVDSDVARCMKCPLIRRSAEGARETSVDYYRVSTASWPLIQTYDPTHVVTEESWL